MKHKELKTDMINTAKWAGLRIDDIQAENLPPDFFYSDCGSFRKLYFSKTFS